MAEEIAFENGRISNFEGLVTLTLTLDRVILHTVVHHSSTSTYTPNFIEIEETSCGQTFDTHFIRSTRNSQPKNQNVAPENMAPYHKHLNWCHSVVLTSTLCQCLK